MQKYNHNLIALARNFRKNSTVSEKLLWKHLRRKQMVGYKFFRQKPVGNYIIDFYCPNLMLAIEIDGITHLNKYKKDTKRQDQLESLGIKFLRFDAVEIVKDIEKVLWLIEQWIIENKPSPQPPPREGE